MTTTNPTRPRLSRKRKELLYFWAFVGPALLGIVVFIYVPVGWGLVLSLFEARSTVTPTKFVGLQNYFELFRDVRFLNSLGTIAVFALVIVPVTYALSLGLALLVNRLGFASGLFRTVIFIPTACSYVAASVIWKLSLFNGLPSGFMNNLLWLGAGANPVAWINTVSPPLYWLVLISVRLWLQSGFYMIIFLAGLQEVPKALYEAAKVDGARPGWQTFRSITLPLLRNTSVSVLLLLFIEAFQAFDEFKNILGGATSSGTQILARPPLIYLYNVAFQDQNYGRGAAGAFTVALIILLVTVLQARLFGFGRKT